MSIQNYNTTRNKELKYWQRIPLQASVSYDKFQLLKKLQTLHAKHARAAIWVNLMVWLTENRRLTYKQQVTIDTAYKKLHKNNKKDSALILQSKVVE